MAFVQAHRTFAASQAVDDAKAVFLAFVEKGTIGLDAALAGTPCV